MQTCQTKLPAMKDGTPTRTLNDFDASSSASAPATRHLQGRRSSTMLQALNRYQDTLLCCQHELCTSNYWEPCHQQAERGEICRGLCRSSWKPNLLSQQS